jgi:catalase
MSSKRLRPHRAERARFPWILLDGAAPLAVGAADAVHETPATMVSALHTAFGQHHARAVHTKGIVLEGSFTPTASGRQLSRASVFGGGTLPVTARFSDFTRLPDIPDTAGEANPRGFATKFRFADGSETDIVTHSFNGFPTRTSDEFAQLLRALGASGPDVPKPTALDRFLDIHPVAKTFLTAQKPASMSYATLTYYGVNAFAFVDGQQRRSYVRYRFVPKASEQFLDAAGLRSKGPDYLADEIASRVLTAPIEFDWYAQVAGAGDVIDDPSVAWPESRRLVLLGTTTIRNAAGDLAQADKALLSLPAKLRAGIEVADPMVTMRHQAYPLSFAERQ